jgi:hypothetical protein
MKLESIKLTQFPGDDVSKFFAFKTDFIAYVHSRDDIPVKEKFARLLSATAGGPANDLISYLPRTDDGYKEALDQLDADYGNLDRQLTSALSGLRDLQELNLRKSETIRVARVAMRKVVAHLRQIPNMNVASHASTVLMALKINYETRYSLNTFLTARGEEVLTFELFEQWAKSQLLLMYEGSPSLGGSGTDGATANTAMPYKPKLPPKTVSVAMTGDDSGSDGCSDLGNHMDESMTVMAVSRDEVGKYTRCINCSQDHPLSK